VVRETSYCTSALVIYNDVVAHEHIVHDPPPFTDCPLFPLLLSVIGLVRIRMAARNSRLSFAATQGVDEEWTPSPVTGEEC
jgi:hypothetical protein